jgi:hypothetical protein
MNVCVLRLSAAAWTIGNKSDSKRMRFPLNNALNDLKLSGGGSGAAGTGSMGARICQLADLK